MTNISPKTIIPFWTSEWMDSVKKNNFIITFTTPTFSISGIFIVKQINGEWKGTAFNEFGVKVLDFVSSAKRCELFNVISFLDKWPIKKVIASDIQFIMEIDNPNFKIGMAANRQFVEDNLIVNYKKEKELHRFSHGEVKYENYKRMLTYSFIIL